MKKQTIAIVGSLNMDLVVTAERMPRVGETIEGTNIHYLPGGKGANQAVGCAKLGAEAIMLGCVGGDAFGQEISARLRDYGVIIEHLMMVEQLPTGTATILHTKEDNCIIVVPGANAHTDERLVAQHQALIQQSDLLLTQLEIPLSAVTLSLQLARNAGVRTVLNPAPAKALPEELLQLVDILTPNETEFEELSGQSYPTEEALQEGMMRWEQRYQHTLIVTRGARGVSYLQEGKLHTVPAPFVEIVDTTGAGDSFNAALCCSLASGETLETAVRFAVRAASLSVTKFGAQNGMPTLEEVNHQA
jgi:ribokinase